MSDGSRSADIFLFKCHRAVFIAMLMNAAVREVIVVSFDFSKDGLDMTNEPINMRLFSGGLSQDGFLMNSFLMQSSQGGHVQTPAF